MRLEAHPRGYSRRDRRGEARWPSGYTRSLQTACLLFVLLWFCGCATTGRFWPSGAEWKKAATGAATHPGTWVPMIGAATVALGGWDHDISDWARRETPLFGSTATAEECSDGFRTAAYVGMVASALAVHDGRGTYWPSMLRRMVSEHVGVAAAIGVREPVRRLTDRERPNGEPMSFPSGHSTTAFAHAGMTYRNVEALHFAPVWVYSAKSAAAGLGTLTAWARIEAGKHYPTDVLVGAALGNFVALLIHDAFLGREDDVDLRVNPDGVAIITLQWML